MFLDTERHEIKKIKPCNEENCFNFNLTPFIVTLNFNRIVQGHTKVSELFPIEMTQIKINLRSIVT